jgi:hypothetical protein
MTMNKKATPSDSLRDQLSQNSEITISVTGRKSGHKISIPVWFVLEDKTLYLLPARGSSTQWYKNVLKKAAIGIESGSAKAEITGTPITDAKQVRSVIDKFHGKYGDSGIKLYKKLDVAVAGELE